MEAELRRLRSEVAELKGALATTGDAAKSDRDNIKVPEYILYDSVQFIPLMMNSGPCNQGETPQYGATSAME